MQQPQDEAADHPPAGYRPPNVMVDMTWLDKFLRDAIQRNGAALAEMQQAKKRKRQRERQTGSSKTGRPSRDRRVVPFTVLGGARRFHPRPPWRDCPDAGAGPRPLTEIQDRDTRVRHPPPQPGPGNRLASAGPRISPPALPGRTAEP